MLHYTPLLLVAVISSCQGLNRPESPPTPSGAVEPRQLIYVSGRQQYTPNVQQYDLPLLEPQFQLPPYNFIQDKQPFPRVQPQLLLYPGGADPGQHFYLQPGSPPGNFLVPQPGPNVIIRDTPQRPVFVAGYPKPAHVPPIEKDAEEIPTNPAKIPPIASPARKPEKLETFNEPEKSDLPRKHATEADVLAAADKTPFYNTKISTTNDLKPGQRFFILNGQSLFSNFPFYPYSGGFNPNLKYRSGPTFLPQGFNQLEKQLVDNNPNYVPIQSLLQRNGVTGQIDSIAQNNPGPLANKYSDNLVLLNQPENYQEEAIFRSALPLTIDAQKKDVELDKQQLKLNENDEPFGYFKYQTDDLENDAIIIDARDQEESNTDQPNATDPESSVPEKVAEPTIAQAQPGAIALAGPGGVAAAAPRGNAFVGKGGVAVSSPQATAVAGPSKDSPENKDPKPEKKSK